MTLLGLVEFLAFAGVALAIAVLLLTLLATHWRWVLAAVVTFAIVRQVGNHVGMVTSGVFFWTTVILLIAYAVVRVRRSS